jgi:regulator of protease activity HflC (stomatin/prohibitin superfamily)
MSRHAHHHDHDHDHDHDHGHGHDHDALHPRVGAPLNVQELDPASRALAEALRLSFGALKLVMIVLVAAYVLSGAFMVQEGQVALRLRLGRADGLAYEPGGPYFAWPAPIDRVIVVPTTLQQVVLDESFWFFRPPGREALQLDEMTYESQLTPGVDGSLLTGDRNIVHAQWTVNYRILKADAARFLHAVGLADPLHDAADPAYRRLPADRKPMHRAEKLVRWTAEQAIVRVTAHTTADDVVRSNVDRDRIRALVQQRLDALRSGITVTEVLLQRPTPPLAVRAAFAQVSQAEGEKARRIEEARKNAAAILNKVAGSGYAQLVAAIDEYEAARLRDDRDAAEQADRRIADLMNPADPRKLVGGEVATMLGEALAYERRAEQSILAQVDQFQRLLPAYRDNPRIVIDRLAQDARQEILSGDVETIYLPSDPAKQLVLDFNRDPRLQQKRETERYQQAAPGKPAP